MISSAIEDLDMLWMAGRRTQKGRQGGKQWGGQDTSRTPNCPKTSCFQPFGAGALVDARAARKVNASIFNAFNGTKGKFGRKVGRS
jgi:hypothetical protein